jgi:transposase-like protein
MGLGMRRVAEQLGVPHGTARGWRRRWQVRAPALAAALVALAVGLHPGAVRLVADGEAAAHEALGPLLQAVHATFMATMPWAARRGAGPSRTP